MESSQYRTVTVVQDACCERRNAGGRPGSRRREAWPTVLCGYAHCIPCSRGRASLFTKLSRVKIDPWPKRQVCGLHSRNLVPPFGHIGRATYRATALEGPYSRSKGSPPVFTRPQGRNATDPSNSIVTVAARNRAARYKCSRPSSNPSVIVTQLLHVSTTQCDAPTRPQLTRSLWSHHLLVALSFLKEDQR